MVKIPDAANKIPMMFRAQTAGRCQLQRIVKDKEKQDVELWTSEWIEKTDYKPPKLNSEIQTQTYQINWRFVTNGGQDDGIIRPVIGAYGWPYYPGSSMKGIFRSACNIEQKQRYCGKDIGNSDWQPGILRFHGGYPTDEEWQKNLVDIVHPQQPWQVGIPQNKKDGAFALISLYQPELIFGISATQKLTEEEWKKIWNIWEKAIAKGLGCRVSSGYGQSKIETKPLYSCQLKGQGMAAKLLDGEAEFRPNIFRAGIRGHAMRIFGGLTTANQAIELVETLFGGVQNHGTVGLLTMYFEENSLNMGQFGQGAFKVDTYNVEGKLKWFLTQSLPDTQKDALTQLIKALTRFAMIFGGFGKSWRRADHRLFFPDYYEDSRKPLIGCHWQWSGTRSLLNDVGVRSLDKIASYIDDKVLKVAKDWMKLQGITPTPNNYAKDWREAWHPNTVEVWGRLADEAEDSRAIVWFHQAYRKGDRQFNIKEGTIYKSHLTGEAGRDSKVGHIWHRMFPRVVLKKNPDNPKKPIPHKTRQYFELITFFPDNSADSEEFLDFLYDEQKQFKKLWPL
ncbi:MAG: RAMP superfamily protein [Microcoleaceae cyanobacterium]